MKITFIDPQSYSNLAQYDYNLLSNINADILYFGSTLYDQQLPSHVTFHPVFNYNKKKGILKGISYVISLFEIYRHICKNKPDLLHIQWIRLYFIDYLFLKFVKSRGVQVVYTAHNILPHNDTNKKYFKIFKKYYGYVTHIIVHTDSTAKELVEQFDIKKDKISIIPHGLLEEECDNEKVKQIEERIRRLCQLDNKIVLSCLGAQSAYKGFDFVEKLWITESMFNSSSDVHLIIAGKAAAGISYRNLETFTNVSTFNYFLSKEEFEAIINLSDVVLLPYRKISQSGVLLTVLSKRKAILVTNEGGLIDPFKCGKVGWIIGEPKYENFRAAMIDIINNKDLIKDISSDESLWTKINHMFSWEEIGLATTTLYSEIINKRF